MSEYIFNLPDLGEGTVEAEIVEWFVKPGDVVKECDVIADVRTDKANVEVPCPASGEVLRTQGEPGDLVAVGSELIALSTDGAAPAADTTPPAKADNSEQPPQPAPSPAAPIAAAKTTQPSSSLSRQKVLTSPAIRRRANELGIDLTQIQGSGPKGRIVRGDLDGIQAGGRPNTPPRDDIEEIKVIGVRRVIANRMQQAKQEIPHFSYVEEVDITALESTRQAVNSRAESNLTYLPFIGLALIRALREFPQCNARYDGERGVIIRHSAVHLGIATQTPDGLKVPVVQHAEQHSLSGLAQQISGVSQRARDGSATPQELTGSTITLTSLGKMGGIVSTPVINSPEMAIIGVNKAIQRPMVVDGQVEVRLMMNLSSSFDHRFIDGYDAAELIQTLKSLLEEPALIFID